jgi:hypothetical protein
MGYQYIAKADHSFLDRRSLAFHVAIAEKLSSDPKLLERFAIGCEAFGG